MNLSINMTDGGMGWAATGFHDALPDRTCRIFYGSGTAAMATPATQPGVVTCES